MADGASTAQQSPATGPLDDMRIPIAPLLLRGGIRLLGHLGPEHTRLAGTRMVDSPVVTHIGYRAAEEPLRRVAPRMGGSGI